MPLNNRGQRVKTHNLNKQKAQAHALRNKSTGGQVGSAIGAANG